MSNATLISHDSAHAQVCSSGLAIQLIRIGLAEIVTESPLIVKFKGKDEKGDPLPEVIYTKKPTPVSPLLVNRKRIPAQTLENSL
jgi:hypothetical protein